VYGELLETYRPDLALRIEALRGLKRFSRSISFLSFVYFLYLSPGGVVNVVGNTTAVAVTVLLWLRWIFVATLPGRFGRIRHEISTVIVLAVLALIVAIVIGVSWQTIYPVLNSLFLQICILAVALLCLLLAGMVDFYERATIAMYLHIECPPTVKYSLIEISAALNESAKRIGPDSPRPVQSQTALHTDR
jgi:phosphotransferase system  glucose/maltose/N-acetylglucosamine-specific IIC component